MSPTSPTKPARGTGRAALLIAWGVVVVAIVAVAAFVVAIVFTSQPSYFMKYKDLKRRDTALASSAHRDIPCTVCHVDSRGPIAAQASLALEFYSSMIGTAPALPTFVKFGPPENSACLGCHLHDWSTDASTTARIPHPAHMRVSSETRDCVECHKWISHEEQYQAKHKTMPFSAVCASFGCHVGTKQKSDCVSCHHVLQENKGDWRETHPQTVRTAGPGGCFENCHVQSQCDSCHATGTASTLPTSIATASAGPVEVAHEKADWLSQHGTLAIADPAKCDSCHVSKLECQDCHAQRPAFHGPTATWLTKHKDFAKDDRRCLACHEKPWCDACHAKFKETR